MANNLINEVLKMNFKSSSVKFIVTILASHANKEGECWVSYATLAQETQLTKSFIIKVIKNLEKDGILLKKKRLHKNKRSRSNLYKILPDFIPNLTNKGVVSTPSGVLSVH